MSATGQKNKVLVISGGSRGLGQAIIENFINDGWQVATFSRLETDFIKTLKNSHHDHFVWEAIDCTDFKALRKFVLQVYKHFGRIDALINNAGVALDRLLAVTTDEEIDYLLDINLTAAIHLCRAVSRIMLQEGDAGIINISSVVGHRGFKGSSVYGAAKAALDGLSRSLARELGSGQIRVNSISPGFIETDMTKNMPEKQRAQIIRRTPLGRLGTVDDIIGLIRFLLGPDAKFITGQSFIIDGGLSC